jgi:hypothetical protein
MMWVNVILARELNQRHRRIDTRSRGCGWIISRIHRWHVHMTAEGLNASGCHQTF